MADVASLVVRITTDGTNVTVDKLKQVENQSSKTEKSTNSLTKAFKDMNSGASNLVSPLNNLKAALATLGIIAIAKEYAQLADTYKLTESRLSLVANGTVGLAQAQQELFKISQTTRQGLKDTIDLYTQIARSTQSLGKSQSDTLKVTEAINKAIIISGSSATSAQAALVQLGQGFASGTLRGEELNSVLEQTPRIAQAIAKGMGVSVGELRTLGEQGKLTADKVFQALQDQAQALDEEFKRMPLTVGQAITQMGNSTLDLIGTIDKITGASQLAANAISAISKQITEFSNSARVASTSVFEQKTVDDITIKATQIADEIKSLQDKIKENDGVLWFGLDDRTTGEYQNRIKRLEQQMEQLGDTAVSVLWKTDEAVKTSVMSGTQVAQNVKKALDSYKLYYQAIGDNETVLAIKRKELLDGNQDLTEKQIDTIINAERNKNNKVEQLAKDWADKKLKLAEETAIAEQDKLAEPYIKLTAEYEKDLERFKSVQGAKEQLTASYNAQVQRLNADTAQKVQEQLDKEAEKQKALNDKEIEKRLKLQEEDYRIRKQQVDLLDDETDKNIALLRIEYERTQASLTAQHDLKQISDDYYSTNMNLAKKLYEKQSFYASQTGQVITAITDDIQGGFDSFVNDAIDGSASIGDAFKGVLKQILADIIKIQITKPLTSAISSGLGSMFDGFSLNAQGGVYDSPSLSTYSNQVVSKPTFFAFANGGVPNLGVMGEKNGGSPEAIIPLTRTSSGDLGVNAEGLGLQQVKIQIINESGNTMEVTKTAQTTDMEGLVIQAWISGVSKNRYGSRDILSSGAR